MISKLIETIGYNHCTLYIVMRRIKQENQLLNIYIGLFTKYELTKTTKTFNMKSNGTWWNTNRSLENWRMHTRIMQWSIFYGNYINMERSFHSQIYLKTINYREITLTSMTVKIYNLMILNRIKSHIDPLLRKNKYGFRKNWFTSEQILTIRRI